MSPTRRLVLASFLLLTAWRPPAEAAAPPEPRPPVPTARQLRWQGLETYAFLHFGPNTFTDKEWGYGDESPALFNPTDFDADAIVADLKTGGMRGLVVTAKHHDGFCLWPSKFTEHSVKNSPWRDGKGDVVRELSDACKRQGLRFGVYLSPWDRNHQDYGKPEYVAYYRDQLRELLTEYGPIFEVWFDGANGGDGYYGGARTTRKIDALTYYEWDRTIALVRELQPDACIFSDLGPDVRWVGNESGVAGDTCWSTFDPAGFAVGKTPGEILNVGMRDGPVWLPAEVDVSIRPGWFYHAAEDQAVKSVDRLDRLYFDSVGRGCNLILNIPPDRRGRIHEADARAIKDWRRRLDDVFARDLARGATATADQTRGDDPAFAPGRAVDGDPDTYWSTDDGATTAALTLDLGGATPFDVIRVREHLPLGQRVDRIAVDAWDGTAWKQLATATSIGSQRLIRLTEPTTARRVRLRVLEAAACPAISEFALFNSRADSH
ncbi:alpha-L-fucosidase [Planctomyces sp. SH-PL62]|uniref:alpha-L-fucosidase n=1 Tax=Planctomyces sp. SH-PL62 TaxID=1636152 RepID=UPI00078D9202|nr:alpha-L-fucosidase [Planctomyces sp. SH-PL62]AMV40294.1 Alpha-L-fucosidase [Planctomyces sp. SH-PL62]